MMKVTDSSLPLSLKVPLVLLAILSASIDLLKVAMVVLILFALRSSFFVRIFHFVRPNPIQASSFSNIKKGLDH